MCIYKWSDLICCLYLKSKNSKIGFLSTLAMECRCYQGGEGRTKMKLLRFSYYDFVALGIGVTLVVLVTILARFGL